ncbi:hypothetical protein EON77_21770, partial [bacterium]
RRRALRPDRGAAGHPVGRDRGGPWLRRPAPARLGPRRPHRARRGGDAARARRRAARAAREARRRARRGARRPGHGPQLALRRLRSHPRRLQVSRSLESAHGC